VRLGIDFGTTRTVVAACDRGNYPVISFNTSSGDSQEYYPSVIAEKAGQLCFGFEALAKRGQPGWALCFSFKRWLSAADATPGLRVQVGSTEFDLLSLITRYLEALRQALLSDSNLPRKAAAEGLEATVATPANSFATQRLVTLEAFRNAGFPVLSMLNEPSAAGVEYAHRYRNTLNSRREKVLVYDLGGGTFDVSLVDMQGQAHDVVASRGLARLGGDDFDDVLLELALKQAGISRATLSPGSLVELSQHCRELKESINPNTRKLHVEVERCLSPAERQRLKLPDGKVALVTIDAFDAACAPLLERTLDLVRLTLGAAKGQNGAPGNGAASHGAASHGAASNRSASHDEDGDDDAARDIAGLYVVGGASALPAVARALRATYGRRVKRSPYPSAAIAIGLAIAADQVADYELTERFHHNLGVFREVHGGLQIGFDRIIGPDIIVPTPGSEPVRLSRRYRATHNVGHFRFIECGWLDDSGHPSGDIKPFAEVRFPFDPTLRSKEDLSQVAVSRSQVEGPEIEERYSISEYGTVELTILDRESGYEQHYKIAG
jgi:molecular chaperone DnaK (HSP70)